MLATRAMQAWPGSVRGIYLQDRTPYDRYAFDPYGQTRVASGIPLDAGFSGHIWDACIQQYFAPFRYYNPAAARWTMRDPLGYEASGFNFYAYVGNHPIKYTDRMGLDRTFCVGLIHTWVRIDTYDGWGEKDGQVDLHFGWTPGAPTDHRAEKPEDGNWPVCFSYTVETTKEQDLATMDEFHRRQKKGEKYGKNGVCWNQSWSLFTDNTGINDKIVETLAGPFAGPDFDTCAVLSSF